MDDYTLDAGTATIAALATSTTIPLQIANDSRWEEDETIRITLATPGANTTIGTELTHDDTINGGGGDTKPSLEFSATTTNDKAEADGTKAVTVSLSAISGVDASASYTITGTATGGGTDYTDATSGAGTLSWTADADQNKDITINFTDDQIDENTETIILTLSGISGGAQAGDDLIHTINLADSDDPPPIGFDISGESS